MRRVIYPRISVVGLFVLLARFTALLVSRRREYTVIHVHIAMHMAAVAAVVGQMLAKPVIIKITGMTELRGGILDPDPNLRMRVLRRCMMGSATMQATSEYIRDRLVEVGFPPDRVVLIPNAVDDARFAVERTVGRPGDAAPDAMRAIYVGRLEHEKGVEVLQIGRAHV